MYQARMQPNISEKVLLFGVRMILVKLLKLSFSERLC